MGWLEILPLLRKLLPLLHQAVPVLERTAAARGNSAAALSADALRADLQNIGNSQLTLSDQLRQNSAHLEALSDLIGQNARVTEVYAAQLRDMDTRLASLLTWVRAAVALGALTLIAIMVWLSILMHVGRPA